MKDFIVISKNHGSNEQIIKELQAKNTKLKELLLLVDPAVSGIDVGNTQLKQWNEFIKCFPDENPKRNNER